MRQKLDKLIDKQKKIACDILKRNKHNILIFLKATDFLLSVFV